MKLYNFSTIPSTLLKPVLIDAAGIVRCRSQNLLVVVKHNCRPEKTRHVVGIVVPCDSWTVQGTEVDTDGAVARLFIPTPGPFHIVREEPTFTLTPCTDVIEWAREILRLAGHEFSHVRCVQEEQPYVYNEENSEMERIANAREEEVMKRYRDTSRIWRDVHDLASWGREHYADVCLPRV